MQREVSCGAVVFTEIDGEKKYLIIQSKNGDLGFPKGHVEPGESEFQTALREIKEETGIEPELITGFRKSIEYPLPDKPDVTKQAVYYLAKYQDQEIKIQEEELAGAALYSYEDAMLLLSFDNTKEILTAARDYLEMTPNDRPIYALIKEAITEDGSLERDFSLPPSPANMFEVQFADGAEDGIYIYHCNIAEPTDEELALMEKAVWKVSDGEKKEADAMFLELCRSRKPMEFMDYLAQFLMDNEEKLFVKGIYGYAMDHLMMSPDKELVKIGLIIMSLFDISENDVMKGVIRTLGLCSEYTLYANYCMHNWPNSNEEYFNLAKKTYGWGRIHACTRLQPETEEIRRWFFTTAVDNGVVPAYTAIYAWEKGGAEKVLDSAPLSREDFSYLRDIIGALLDEGPCLGISLIKTPEIPIRKFLHKAQNFKISPRDYEVIKAIQERFEKDAIIGRLCKDIISNM